jgi:hypothetical protein
LLLRASWYSQCFGLADALASSAHISPTLRRPEPAESDKEVKSVSHQGVPERGGTLVGQIPLLQVGHNLTDGDPVYAALNESGLKLRQDRGIERMDDERRSKSSVPNNSIAFSWCC